MSNYHIHQNTILKFRFYFKFLVANNREIAKEIKDHYIDTMSKVTFSYFKSYSGKGIYIETFEENLRLGIKLTLTKNSKFLPFVVKLGHYYLLMG